MTTTLQVLLERYEVGWLLGWAAWPRSSRAATGRCPAASPRCRRPSSPTTRSSPSGSGGRPRRRPARPIPGWSPSTTPAPRTAPTSSSWSTWTAAPSRTSSGPRRRCTRRAAEITADVCSALAAAHARGLVHRDVKPANIMLMPDGRVKLMDLDRPAAAGETVTQTAAMLGTAQYLSPEQAQGQAVDYRSDLYSLGCCLYEMLTGTVPFRGYTLVAIAYRHVREDPAAPRLLNPDIPPALEAVCLKAMAKRPEDRYQTAAELSRRPGAGPGRAVVAAGPAAAGAATAAMATTVLPPLGGYPGAPGDPTAALGGTVAPSRAARHAEPPPGPRRRWWLYVLVPLGVLARGRGRVPGLPAGRRPARDALGPDPAHRHPPTTVQTTLLRPRPPSCPPPRGCPPPPPRRPPPRPPPSSSPPRSRSRT